MIHKAKKSLGQNFLKSEPALRAMCEAGNLNANDVVLEIGPGKGALTAKLLEKASKVIAIEKDRALVTFLKEKFKNEIENKKLELIEGDCLEFEPASYKLGSGEYKIIANIPYNITGAIFKKFLSGNEKPGVMVLLVQKEVAMRIVARDKKESILSLSVKLYGTPKYIMKVGKRFFSPSPKVDSAIIAITDIDSTHANSLDRKFFEVIKAGFAHKRKVLRKNLEILAPIDAIDEVFEKLNIGKSARAEDLPLAIWLTVTVYLSKYL
ncbi:MAG: 16S rRNA (adenine(1518)-N(6)/adenine(1519)-N(6))-dimethyltransferase RsmA [Patescibacteria group bacterium]